MKIFNFILLITLFLSISCQKTKLEVETHDCIKQKIAEFDNSAISCDAGASVYSYQFQGKLVYVFYPGNCGADMISDVYDEDCNLICGLGGIVGNITCNGENFGDNSTEETLIWKN